MSEVTFEPFQKVLVRDENEDEWHADFFSHIYDGIYVCVGHPWKECIPYNDETAHLLGTTNSPTPPEPEFRFGDHVEISYDGIIWLKAVYVCEVGGDSPHKVYRQNELGHGSEYHARYCRHAEW